MLQQMAARPITRRQDAVEVSISTLKEGGMGSGMDSIFYAQHAVACCAAVGRKPSRPMGTWL